MMRLWTSFLSITSFFLTLAPAAGAETVSGTVTDSSGEALPFASVLVLGETVGTAATAGGAYALHLAPGPHTLKFVFIGYESREQEINVNANEPLTLDMVLPESEVVLETITVLGRREQIRAKDSSTRHSISYADLASLPVDSFQEAVALKAGVVEAGGRLHFRGGRDTEVQYRIDGVPVNDPLLGRGVEPATIAVSESEILTGGFDAEYGNAQSGVIEITTREGGDRFEGSVSYMTDDFGGPDKTFNNFDRVSLGFGGPAFSRSLRYFVSAQGSWSDTYLKTTEQRETHGFLDFFQFRDRQDNDLQLQAKVSWLASASGRLTLEWMRNRKRWDAYDHRYSRGLWRTAVIDTSESGEIGTVYGEPGPLPQGPNSVYYNAAEHTPDLTQGFEQTKAVWRQHLGSGTFYSMRISRHGYDHGQRVLGKNPWEYDSAADAEDAGLIKDAVGATFADWGDVPVLSEQSSRVWSLRGDLTSEIGNHRFKSGASAEFNRLASERILYPGESNSQGTFGLVHDAYDVHNVETALYAQDRWEHEGMVLNLGLRLDMFDAGSGLTTADSRGRFRTQLSPRVGFAYPITDRDALSFHYGRFSQSPPRHALYDFREAGGGIRGNLDLQNETTVAYQASLQHRFSETLFARISVYHKEIFGLLGVEERVLPGHIFPVARWANRDYASSRGFELSLSRTFLHGFSGELSYSYGIATGVASDPAQQVRTNFAYLPIAEQPLDWDRRHSLAASFEIAEPGNWSMHVIWRYQSGFPYTPGTWGQRRTDPATVNSARLPGSTTVTLQAEKHYRVWGQAIRLFVRADNLLDARNIVQLTPEGSGSAYALYYSETGRAGGAYLGGDSNGDGNRDWVPLRDPRVFAEGRAFRVGLSSNF